jgi:hypothetical protein
MMKNKVQIMGAGLLALLLVFAGCSNPLGEKPDASPEAVSGGKIVVTLGGLDARTLGPLAADMPELKYQLVLYNYDKIIGEDIADSTKPIEYSIEPGTWTIGVLAYTETEDGEIDNEIAWGQEEDVKILEGELRPVFIALLPITEQEAFGTFNYAVEFPAPTADFGYDATTLTLTPNSPNFASSSPISINLREKAADSLDLPVGRYTLKIDLVSSREIGSASLTATVVEVVYLYPGLPTKAHYNQANGNAFTLADFGAPVYLKGTAQVNNFTATDASGNLLIKYIPKEVQLKKYDDPLGDPDDTNVAKADVTLNTATGKYEWELSVPSEEISGGGPASQVELRLVLEDETDATQTLTSAPEPFTLTPQGLTGISLSPSVYSIVKAANNDYFGSITGVSGIAHNQHAIAGTPVELKIVSAAGYGVRGNQISISSGSDEELAPDGTVSFTMPPSGNVTVNAGFFSLTGSALISGGNPDGYAVASVQAFGEVKNEATGAYEWKSIGSTPTITNTLWAITGFENYVYTGQGTILFKVTMTAVGKTAMEYTTTFSIGTSSVSLYPALNRVTNLRQTAATATSITLSWDAAPWATGGFYIYRSSGGGFTRIATRDAGTTSYLNAELTAGSYSYYITGLYGDPATEGSYTSDITGRTQLATPSNVNASLAANPSYSNYPFRTSITWGWVSGASYYDVYRNGSLVEADVSSTSYYDIEDKTPGGAYVYTVVAKRNTYADPTDSAVSAPAKVNFPYPVDLSLNSASSGTINSSGEVDFYTFTVPASGNYWFRLDSGFNPSVNAYLNGEKQSLNTSGAANYLVSGEKVMITVAASFSGTGSYTVKVSNSN